MSVWLTENSNYSPSSQKEPELRFDGDRDAFRVEIKGFFFFFFGQTANVFKIVNNYFLVYAPFLRVEQRNQPDPTGFNL